MPGQLSTRRLFAFVVFSAFSIVLLTPASLFAGLLAGAAKVDITNYDAGPVNDPLFVKALVLRDGDVTVAIVTVDAVAIAEIGSIKNDYLTNVRAALKREIGFDPERILINASHCHGIVCADVEARTVQAVKLAAKELVPVRVGVGKGREDRVMENRRLKLKSGREADVRHAYSLPPDEEVVGMGPVDPDIGLLRLDRMDGRTLAIVHQFACHPIQGVPSKGNTADMSGFASQVLEDSFGDGAIALFLQGCGGDVNPLRYKQVDEPRDAEPLGNQLGLSAMRAAKKLACRDDASLKWIHETLAVPRADNAERIAAVEAEQTRLLQALRGTSLNLKTFMPLVVKHGLSNPFPSYYSHRYLHDQQIQRNDLEKLDTENRANVESYIRNIYTMEELTRLQTNLALLKKHQARNVAAGSRTMDVEVVGVRIGEFALITFPGELTVQIGLNIKQAAGQPHTFVSGYTNGYIYYAPTADQLRNVGGAQEDSDCLLAPEWQALFEAKALEVLRRLR
ncbi:MAG: hypothetical protein Q8K78_16340 [Planctomycetaceae bacterium]|nr:hypothetical protein [Planctomycetaceae bacterium]